jgi:hypothetical protein
MKKLIRITKSNGATSERVYNFDDIEDFDLTMEMIRRNLDMLCGIDNYTVEHIDL